MNNLQNINYFMKPNCLIKNITEIITDRDLNRK